MQQRVLEQGYLFEGSINVIGETGIAIVGSE